MHLFPASGFDQSAITPVFLGVLVSWFFTETLGWVFVGLVVPGYLATLFLLDARSAAIDVAEALATYAIGRLLCEHLASTGMTSRIFGRERFLVILVVSVLVRLATEGALVPWAIPHAKWAYSIGLVVVPLAANACWKTGLSRGIVQNGVPTLIVYALLRWVLVPHTNLSFAGFHLSIENMATGFLRSPRAYVLLLTGAVLAAIANVRYGWDYGGILIPALLALVVTSPVKLIGTFVEASLLVVTVALLVRFTRVGRWNIEGPRRPVLFLSADYALRFALASVAGRHLPGTEIVELTGLGYLLPSLLAVKVSQKTIAALVFLPTATVSLAAFAVSSAFAFVVTSLGEDALASGPTVTRRVGAAPQAPMLAAVWVAALARPTLGRSALLSSQATKALARAVGAAARGDRLGAAVELQQLHDGFVLVRERFADLEHRRGLPAVLFSTRHPMARRTVALLPAPLAAPQAAALAGHWLENGTVDALVVAGYEEAAGRDPGNEALALARELADSNGGHGLVVAIRGSKAGCVARARSRSATRDAAQAFLQRSKSELADCTLVSSPARDGEEVELDVQPSVADSWLPAPSAAPSLATSSALALALAEVRLTNARPSQEELLVLRRLLLEPLLEGEGGPRVSIQLMAAVARSLGYQLFGPTRLAGGTEGMLLLPRANGAPLALVARLGGAHGLVIEVPHAGSSGLRALALRLERPLSADAVILGLAEAEGAFGNEAFADAHAAAAWPRLGRSSSVLTLREGKGPDVSTIGLAEWGGVPASQLTRRVADALAVDQLASGSVPLDIATREQAGRSVFGDTPVVSITVTPDELHSPRLSVDLNSLRLFDAFALRDADCASVAEALAASLPELAPDAPEDLFDTARVAVSEHSVVAVRTLERWTTGTGARANVVRADTGVYLVLVARRDHALRLGAFPLLFGHEVPWDQQLVAPSASACCSKLALGGICRVEVGR